MGFSVRVCQYANLEPSRVKRAPASPGNLIVSIVLERRLLVNLYRISMQEIHISMQEGREVQGKSVIRIILTLQDYYSSVVITSLIVAHVPFLLHNEFQVQEQISS